MTIPLSRSALTRTPQYHTIARAAAPPQSLKYSDANFFSNKKLTREKKLLKNFLKRLISRFATTF